LDEQDAGSARPVWDQFIDRLIRPLDAHAYDGLSVRRRYELEALGLYPARKQLGPRATGYLLSEIVAWVRSRPKAGPVAAQKLLRQIKGGAT
jgi:predicted DNA-binding transcriptional regulator AlpA